MRVILSSFNLPFLKDLAGIIARPALAPRSNADPHPNRTPVRTSRSI